jgi:hypothetical protein
MKIVATKTISDSGWKLETRYNTKRNTYKLVYRGYYLPDTFYSAQKAIAFAIEYGIAKEAK